MFQYRLPAFLVVLGLAVPGLVLAQTSVPVECADDKALRAMLTEYGEQPMLIGTSTRQRAGQVWEFPTVLFTNRSTGSWTLVEQHGPDLYCAVAMGGDIRPFYQSVEK